LRTQLRRERESSEKARDRAQMESPQALKYDIFGHPSERVREDGRRSVGGVQRSRRASLDPSEQVRFSLGITDETCWLK